MAFDGTEGGFIDLEAAAAMTAEHRRVYPNAHKCQFFGRDKVLELLEQSGCMGIRVYHGLNKEGERELIFVGADADGEDMLDMVLDLSPKCPNNCPSTNALNC